MSKMLIGCIPCNSIYQSKEYFLSLIKKNGILILFSIVCFLVSIDESSNIDVYN